MRKSKKSKFAAAISLLVCCCMLFGGTAMAEEEPTAVRTTLDATIYSEEFPDALVECEVIPATSKNGDLVGQVVATVYYEEEYKDIGGKTICTSSRLLPKQEVEAIGKDKFDGQIVRDELIPSDSASKGTLTIQMLVYRLGDNSHNIVGTADWSGSFNGISSTRPAYGDDYIGITWGGQFDSNNESAYATNNFGLDVPVYDADSTPNVGQVWQFYEGASDREELDWVTHVGCSLDVNKETLTGSGNTTSFVLKYIHTYQSTSGTISISNSGGGFTLSSVEKQWGLVAKLSGFKY